LFTYYGIVQQFQKWVPYIFERITGIFVPKPDMNYSNSLLLGCLFVGMAFYIVGNLLRTYPPKKINHWYGYRTPSSMRSQERWDFAQLYAAKEMIKHGFILTMIGILFGFFFQFDETINAILIVSLVLLSSISMIVFTERAIKKNFKERK